LITDMKPGSMLTRLKGNMASEAQRTQ
jgi:hypothetical protein